MPLSHYKDCCGFEGSEVVTAKTPFSSKETVVAKYNTLDALRTKKVADVEALTPTPDKLETTKDFRDYKKGQLDDLKISDISEEINAYDLTNTTSGIVQAEKNIIEKIEGADGKGGVKAKVNNLTADLASKKSAYDENARVQKLLNAAILLAYDAYDAALVNVEELFKVKYPNWYNNMTNQSTGELAQAHNRIMEEERLYAQYSSKMEDATTGYSSLVEKRTIDGSEVENGKLLFEASDIIDDVTDKYVALKDAYEKDLDIIINGYEKNGKHVPGLREAVKDLTDALTSAGIYDANKAAVDAITASIDKVEADVKAKKDVTTNVADFDITASVNSINANIEKLYTPNLKAYKDVLDDIADVEEDLDEAVKKATETLSDDKTYNAAAHFTKTESNIRKAIEALRTEAKAKYDAGTATEYKPDFKDVNGKISAYGTDAERALKAYNKYAPALKTLSDALAALNTEVGINTGVPVSSLSDDSKTVTYGNVIADVNAKLAAVNKAITEANAKDGAAHADALEGIANTDWTDPYSAAKLNTFKTSFAADKAVYDNVVAVQAAEAMFTQRTTQLTKLYDEYNAILTNANNGENGIYGNQAAKIKETAADATTKIGADEKVTGLRKDIATKYATIKDSETDAEKNAAASAFLAYLSTISTDIDNLVSGLADLKTTANAATINKSTYDYLLTLESGVTAAIAAEKNDIDKVTSGSGATYYKTTVLDGLYGKELAAWKAAVKADYDALTSYANEDKRTEERNTLLKKVQGVDVLAKANDVAYNELLVKVNGDGADIKGLEKTREELYQKILAGDQSLKATEYLDQLLTIKTQINTLLSAIIDDFGKGNSVLNKTTRQATITELSTAIDNIAKAQYDYYSTAIYETNKISHDRFGVAYDLTMDMFAAAVDTLGEFNAITNPVIREIVTDSAKILEVHAEIYKYADKLRELYAAESKDYSYYQSDENLNQEKHENIKIFEAATFIETANNYRTELQSLVEDYRDRVNSEVYDKFNVALGYANTELDANAIELIKWGYLICGENNDTTKRAHIDAVRKIAYGATDEAVQTANKATGAVVQKVIDGKGKSVPADPLYAKVIESTLSKINSTADDINIMNVTLARQEMETRRYEAYDIVSGDLAMLNTFEPSGKVKEYQIEIAKNKLEVIYVKLNLIFEQYWNLLDENVYDDIKELKVTLANTVVYDYCNLPSDAVDAKKSKHTKEFAEVSDGLWNFGVNGVLYQNIVTEVEAIKGAYAELRDFVNQFFTVHTLTSGVDQFITGKLSYYDVLVFKAESDWTIGKDLTQTLNDVKGYRTGKGTNTLETDVNNMRLQVIIEELNTLYAEIDGLKEDYNKAFIKSAGDAEKLTELAELEKEIANLSTDLLTLQGEWNKTAQDAAAITAMTPKLLAFEGEIAALNKTLVAYYNPKAEDEAKDAFEAACKPFEKLRGDYKDAFDLFAENPIEAGKIKDEFEDRFNKVNASYGNLLAEKQGREEAGTLLFYADNLVNDANDLTVDTDVKKLTEELSARVDKLGNNLLGKQNIDKKIEQYRNDLKVVNDEVTGYAPFDGDTKKPFDDNTNLDDGKPTDVRENRYEAIELLIKTAEEYAKASYKDEALNPGSRPYNAYQITDGIEKFWKEMTKIYAEYKIDVVDDSICKIIRYIDEATKVYTRPEDQLAQKKYEPTVLKALNDGKEKLVMDLSYVSTYNNDSYSGSRVFAEITGEKLIDPVTNEPMGKPVEYRPVENDNETEYGWPTVDRRIGELLDEATKLLAQAESDYYIIGDADGNRKVNVNDWASIRNYVLGAKKVTDVLDVYGPSAAYAADIDETGDYTINDITQVANLVFAYKSADDNVAAKAIAAQARVLARVPVQSNDAISLAAVSEETSVFGKNIRLAVNLDNTIDYVGYQMDIKLPAGMTLAGESLTERANGHELVSNDVNGMHRVVVATIENNAFLNDGDAVLYLDVQVGSDYNGGDVEISNVIFSDAKRMYKLNGVNTNAPTGIDSITAPTVSERIYSVGGQMMKAVKKGVNIIIGNDGSTKKVIKK